MGKAIAWAAALPLLLGGCAKLFGTVVQMPQESTASMLYNMGPGANLMNMPVGVAGTSFDIKRSADGVVWTYSRYGRPSCEFTAYVSAESDESSLVWTGVDDISAGGEDYLCAAVNVLGKESVAATLEGRNADSELAQKEMAALVPAHMQSIFKGIGEEVDRAAKGGPRGCEKLDTSAAQAACNGNNSLIDRSSRSND